MTSNDQQTSELNRIIASKEGKDSDYEIKRKAQVLEIQNRVGNLNWQSNEAIKAEEDAVGREQSPTQKVTNILTELYGLKRDIDKGTSTELGQKLYGVLHQDTVNIAKNTSPDSLAPQMRLSTFTNLEIAARKVGISFLTGTGIVEKTD